MMITNEIFLETVGIQFEHLRVEIEQLRAMIDQLSPKARTTYEAGFNELVGEQARLAEALKNLSLATPYERMFREAEATQEFNRLQRELHRLKDDVGALLLTDRPTQSIGWAEGMAEDNPIDTIGWAEGMAAEHPIESIGWAEGLADEDPVESIGWAEGYKHE
ncbi:MAG: hypothetical protein KDI62_25820 [Anaerolineae bacterium]|nr:hypothetical protein [Anaerolineae bacterium]